MNATQCFVLADADGYLQTIRWCDEPPSGSGWICISSEALPHRPPGFEWRLNLRTMTWEDPRSDELKVAIARGQVREQRNALLAATDWTALPDVPLSEERRQQWQAYRQALRDVTDQPDPFNIVWPVPPA